MASQPEQDPRTVRIRQIVADCRQRLAQGTDFADREILVRHPDLLPELADELKKLRRIEAARREAAQRDARTARTDTASSSLIRQVQRQENSAWNRLVHLYTPLVYFWCDRAKLQTADIEDVVQNVFLAVHKSINGFRRESDRDTFSGWLWTITRNEVRMHFRRRKKQPQASGGSEARERLEQMPELFEPEELPAELSGKSLLVHEALRMIRAEFEPDTWQAFRRTAIDELSAAEAAAEIGTTPGAVRNAKYKVLRRLREFLEEDLDLGNC